MQVAQQDKGSVIRAQMALEQIADCDELALQLASIRASATTKQFDRSSKSAPAPDRVQRVVARDPEQPRARVVRVSECLLSTHGVMEYVLQKVLGERPIADHLD
jgi:hypothetical protein